MIVDKYIKINIKKMSIFGRLDAFRRQSVDKQNMNKQNVLEDFANKIQTAKDQEEVKRLLEELKYEVMILAAIASKWHGESMNEDNLSEDSAKNFNDEYIDNIDNFKSVYNRLIEKGFVDKLDEYKTMKITSLGRMFLKQANNKRKEKLMSRRKEFSEHEQQIIDTLNIALKKGGRVMYLVDIP